MFKNRFNKFFSLGALSLVALANSPSRALSNLVLEIDRLKTGKSHCLMQIGVYDTSSGRHPKRVLVYRRRLEDHTYDTNSLESVANSPIRPFSNVKSFLRDSQGNVLYSLEGQGEDPSYPPTKLDGYPIYIYADGSIFLRKADYGNGREKGTLIRENSVYSGDFRNGRREGRGKEVQRLECHHTALYKAAEENHIDGHWEDDKFNGYGEITIGISERIVGTFENDHPINGTIYYDNGASYEGGFRSKDAIGYPAMVSREGDGELIFPDGTKFRGEWGRRNGEQDSIFLGGTYVSKRGREYRVKNMVEKPLAPQCAIYETVFSNGDVFTSEKSFPSDLIKKLSGCTSPDEMSSEIREHCRGIYRTGDGAKFSGNELGDIVEHLEDIGRAPDRRYGGRLLWLSNLFRGRGKPVEVSPKVLQQDQRDL
ncbi:MAG: hypothetical protein LBU15_04335 [Rickettsiales bacterium]|jgi:hypothetical protein|nr:hypothetical protein [Rickettsiales bacterium]